MLAEFAVLAEFAAPRALSSSTEGAAGQRLESRAAASGARGDEVWKSVQAFKAAAGSILLHALGSCRPFPKIRTSWPFRLSEAL